MAPAERVWWSSQVGRRARVFVRLEAVWAGAKNHQRQRHQPGLVGVAIIHICAYSPPMNCMPQEASAPFGRHAALRLAALQAVYLSDLDNLEVCIYLPIHRRHALPHPFKVKIR